MKDRYAYLCKNMFDVPIAFNDPDLKKYAVLKYEFNI